MKRAVGIAIAILASEAVLAQHEGHQMGQQGAGGACVANAKESLRIVENASLRLDEARQTNSPQRMRAAMDDLQAALAEVRTKLSLCVSPDRTPAAAPGAEGMDHGKMERMDHSKTQHDMGAVPSKTPTPPRTAPPTQRLMNR